MAAKQTGPVAVVLGAQWGDEGKGKLVDILSEQYEICARYNGGSNAGHTIVKNGQKFAVHLLPSGVLTEKSVGLIGNGVVLHVPSLIKEIESVEAKGLSVKGRLLVSDRAHIVFDFHRTVDGASEEDRGKAKLGTTRQGIGPAYASKMERRGIRVHHLFEDGAVAEMLPRLLSGWDARFGPLNVDVDEVAARYTGEYADLLRDMVVDCGEYLCKALDEGRSVLIEGANAIHLDIDHGTYPYVTSSSPSIGGACTGLALPPSRFAKAEVIGIVKAYTTRVGEGPFPTELPLDAGIGKQLLDIGHEYGTTTGRPRRCGWLDLPLLRYSHRVNDFTSINLTKLDVLDQIDEIQVCTAYELDGEQIGWCASLPKLARVQVRYETLPGWKQDISAIRTFEELPENARNYVLFVERQLGIFVRWIGVGASAEAMIERQRD